MSCIPQSGGCERSATDALVAHLNASEGTHYEYQACLDRLDRTRPQPECRYVDAGCGQSLVIERKSISWPESYPYHHSKDHDLAEEIGGRLTEIDFPDIYFLRMPVLGRASKEEISAMGQFVAQAIRSQFTNLTRDKVRMIESLGRSFQFGIQPLEDRYEYGPDRGLVFLWPLKNDWPKSSDLAEELRPHIEKVYTACVRKFADHAESRRVLMLDPHGDIRYTNARWWNQVLSNCPPPPSIDEIWIGSNGSNDWGEEEWLIEKAFGGLVEFPDLLPIPIGE